MQTLKNIILKFIVIIRKLIIKDCSNLDLSNIDFSNYPFEFWKDVVINNTNFNNSKINFNPKYLPREERKLENVNFENVDLSYLTDVDFERITIENTNFKNTGLKINFNNIKYPSKTLYNVTLDKNIVISPYQIINLETLKLNPDYPFADMQIVQAVVQTFDYFSSLIKEARTEFQIEQVFGMTKKQYYEQMNEYINQIIFTLQEYKRFNMINIIKKMLEHSDIDDVFNFLTYQRLDTHLKYVDFSKEEIDILNTWIIKNELILDHCTFDIDYKSASEQKKLMNGLFSVYTKLHNCSFSNNSYSNEKLTKILNTPFSCHTSIYIKVGNKCNGSCTFCKNKTEDKSITDISKITESLCSDDILPHLNEIYFGGGEPSLYLEEINQIVTQCYNTTREKRISMPNLYFFTNGGGNWEELYNYLPPMFNVILSRHEIEDEKNKKIIGVDYSLDDPHIKELIKWKKIIFSLTCSDLNMRENFLEEYFKFGRELGIKKFIIQSLEAKTDINIPYLDEYLAEFKDFLIEQGLGNEKKIVSTSYFDLILLSGNGYFVSLKKYFQPEELESRMKHQPRHSFDLGMDSNGDIYNDFQMIKKLTR